MLSCYTAVYPVFPVTTFFTFHTGKTGEFAFRKKDDEGEWKIHTQLLCSVTGDWVFGGRAGKLD